MIKHFGPVFVKDFETIDVQNSNYCALLELLFDIDSVVDTGHNPVKETFIYSL